MLTLALLVYFDDVCNAECALRCQGLVFADDRWGAFRVHERISKNAYVGSSKPLEMNHFGFYTGKCLPKVEIIVSHQYQVDFVLN